MSSSEYAPVPSVSFNDLGTDVFLLVCFELELRDVLSLRRVRRQFRS
jgi:hypothetical protein